MDTKTLEIDTGRGEWDEDYQAKALETKALETKALETKGGSGAGPQSTAAQSQRPAIATYPHNKAPSHDGLGARELPSKDSLPVNHFGAPSSSANNGVARRASESTSRKVPPWITKKFTDTKKSKQGWAEHPGLITTRKGNQIALDAATNKYLGPITVNTDFKCTVIVTIITTKSKLTGPGIFRSL
ncbi:hypothetical protein VC83_02603 [Pseudogymnoascus destructans]|uniref:Uncharacterized protein n=1 Tax=Pseudogymnoascus destructans TaxID=655981 RepID=A0A177AHN9_9PEZI|nr:uncharacterized protein VC83_02603 [Pseudogymnoascus destructans]OAF60791.1 hypothetical protein VC83_02603 [Pseudogymnoascus destructans]